MFSVRLALTILVGTLACGPTGVSLTTDASNSAGDDPANNSSPEAGSETQSDTSSNDQAQASDDGASTDGKNDSADTSDAESTTIAGESTDTQASVSESEDSETDAATESATGDEVGTDNPGDWDDLADMPDARQEVAVVAVGDDVYVLGGFGADHKVTDSVLVYNSIADDWRTGPKLPVSMHHANAVALDGQIHVVGSLDGDWKAQADIFVLDIGGSNTWTTVAGKFPAGRERGGSGIVALDGKIYIMGGLRGPAVRDCDAFDPKDLSWTSLPDLPGNSDHLVAGAWQGRVITIGGRNGQIGSHFAHVFHWQPGQSAWQSGADMPTSRAGTAMAQAGRFLFVFGGEGNAEASDGVFPQAQRYDAQNDTWFALTDMPTPRHGTGAALVRGKIVVPGGADMEGFAAIATVESFSP